MEKALLQNIPKMIYMNVLTAKKKLDTIKIYLLISITYTY